nr:PREDICTED: LOW QUALITY PROTEIN: SKI/DACH domain-containing protein 1-like [Linepithema humile]
MSGGGYYDDRNPLLKGNLSRKSQMKMDKLMGRHTAQNRAEAELNVHSANSIERDRLRERDRQARAAMSVQAEQAAAGGGPDTRHHHHHHHNHVHHHHPNHHVTPPNLFRAPVRTTPDPEIESKLGSYSLVKHLLDDSKRLIGVDGISTGSSTSSSSVSHHRSNSGSSSRGCSSSAGQEFKKPGGPRGSNSASSSSSGSSSGSQQQRGGFVKPADSKPPYGGRGGYPGQPIKQPINSNDHRRC